MYLSGGRGKGRTDVATATYVASHMTVEILGSPAGDSGGEVCTPKEPYKEPYDTPSPMILQKSPVILKNRPVILQKSLEILKNIPMILKISTVILKRDVLT